MTLYKKNLHVHVQPNLLIFSYSTVIFFLLKMACHFSLIEIYINWFWIKVIFYWILYNQYENKWFIKMKENRGGGGHKEGLNWILIWGMNWEIN